MRAELRADCTRCAALCCVAPTLMASADFAIDKPAGRPCPNLRTDLRCGIHADLRSRGFPGCVAYDCFGAGQKLTQETFRGMDWRTSAQVADRMFAALPVLRHLHELLLYLTEALDRTPPGRLHRLLAAAHDETLRAASVDGDALAALDLPARHREVAGLLRRVSDAVRAQAGGRPRSRRGADLVGADLRRSDLRGTDLAGAHLIGADLRGADLRLADLVGADLRGADLRGADLSDALFLVGPQLSSAVGDAATRLPAHLPPPEHWTVRSSE